MKFEHTPKSAMEVVQVDECIEQQEQTRCIGHTETINNFIKYFQELGFQRSFRVTNNNDLQSTLSHSFKSPKCNHSLLIVPRLPRHAPCWRDMPYLLYFSFLNTFILEISNCILKFI